MIKSPSEFNKYPSLTELILQNQAGLISGWLTVYRMPRSHGLKSFTYYLKLQCPELGVFNTPLGSYYISANKKYWNLYYPPKPDLNFPSTIRTAVKTPETPALFLATRIAGILGVSIRESYTGNRDLFIFTFTNYQDTKNA